MRSNSGPCGLRFDNGRRLRSNQLHPDTGRLEVLVCHTPISNTLRIRGTDAGGGHTQTLVWIKSTSRQLQKDTRTRFNVCRCVVGQVKTSTKYLVVQLLQLGKLELSPASTGQLAQGGRVFPAGINDGYVWKRIFQAGSKIFPTQNELIVLQVVAHQTRGLRHNPIESDQSLAQSHAFYLR